MLGEEVDMDLFEWLGEMFNPGPVGDIKFGGRGSDEKRPWAIVFYFCLTILMIGGIYYLVHAIIGFVSFKSIAYTAAGVFLYCLVSYFISPQADTSNIGWLGGLVDHPFRYSDDLNRWLLFFALILFPGLFIAQSIVDFVRFVVKLRQKNKEG